MEEFSRVRLLGADDVARDLRQRLLLEPEQRAVVLRAAVVAAVAFAKDAPDEEVEDAGPAAGFFP